MDGVRSTIPAHAVASHVTCTGCGYDLYAANVAGKCPECGLAVKQSAGLALALAEPANARSARLMGNSLLVSSIFAGLCPAACLLLLNLENLAGAIMVLVAFGTCAIFAAIAERARLRLAPVIGTPSTSRTLILYDMIAGVGLLLIGVAGVLYGIKDSYNLLGYDHQSLWEGAQAALAGGGFFALFLTAWRAIPAWRAQAEFAQLLGAKRLKKFLTFLAWTKAIFETVWLLCCSLPFGLALLQHESGSDAAIFFAIGAFFGLFGFAAIWLMMIIAHSVLLVQIRKQTKTLGNA